MRRFSFKLEKVLELRRFAEREWEHRLAEATSRVIEVENEISDWAERRTATSTNHVPAGRVDMGALRSREDYVNLIDDRVYQLQSRLVTLEAERKKVRSGYLEVSQKRKALSKLKERQGDEYYKDALKEETRSLDEIAVSMTAGKLAHAEDEHV